MHGDNFFKSLESMPFVANIRNNNTIDTSKFLTLTDEDFSKAYPESDFTVFNQTQIDAFSGDLRAEFNQLTTEEDRKDLVEKAQKDLSKLIKVTKTDKNGKKMTVYVAPKHDTPKEFNANSVILSGKGTKEQYGEIGKNHYVKLSHINKIRFERDYEKHFGTKYDKETKYGEGTKTKETNSYHPNSKMAKMVEASKNKKIKAAEIGRTKDNLSTWDYKTLMQTLSEEKEHLASFQGEEKNTDKYKKQKEYVKKLTSEQDKRKADKLFQAFGEARKMDKEIAERKKAKKEATGVLKIETEKVQNNKNNPNYFTEHHKVNGKIVASYTKSKDAFHTIKNGVPSNIRDNYKTTHSSRFDRENLIDILGVPKDDRELNAKLFGKEGVFRNPDGPDLKWGSQGSKISKLDVKSRIDSAKQIIKDHLTKL